MEKLPTPKGNTPASSYESPLGRFEVVELKKITASDVAAGDRAYIHTESGNRYMLRHSKSRNGALIIYNERAGNGFRAENGHPFVTRADTIAAMGERLEYFEISDESNRRGSWANSTKVIRIEVRKGLEAAVEQAAGGGNQKASGQGLAKMLIDEVNGRRRGSTQDSN